MRLRVRREAFPGEKELFELQWLHKLMGLRGHRSPCTMPRGQVETSRGISFNLRNRYKECADKGASSASGREGSTGGQVEKTEDFAQSQPQDEIRR
jgi:hypothetical protein